MKTVLTIAGFDPSSGAGITADLAVFAAHGLNGTSAITALTVQSSTGVRSVHPLAPSLLRDTLDCLQQDLPPDGIKIGMLASAAVVTTVCDYLESIRPSGSRPAEMHPVVVLDPVLRSSAGRELIDPEGAVLLRNRLLPLVDWITPNLQELAILSHRSVAIPADLKPAAHQLQQAVGTRLGVLATGGHLDAPDDLLIPPGSPATWLRGSRIQTRATHGTGCALSSAFLAGLVRGAPAEAAARSAKAYVEGAMRQAAPTGSGPCRMNHLWKILEPES